MKRLQAALSRWRVRRKRRRLKYAYAKVGRIRHGMGPGFTPLLYAYECLLAENLVTIEDGELVWLWPEDDDL